MLHFSYTQAVEYIQALPKKSPPSFSALYPNANPLAIDLMQKMLVFDPAGRTQVCPHS